MWYLQWLDSAEALMHADVADSATAGRVAYAIASTYDVPVHVWQQGRDDFGYDILPSGQLVVTMS